MLAALTSPVFVLDTAFSWCQLSLRREIHESRRILGRGTVYSASAAFDKMKAKAESGAIPPGFARPLTSGEVPLMACSDHNRPPDAPAIRTYRMLLPSSAHQARGYHSLRFLRLQRIHLKKRWQKAVVLLLLACVGFVLMFWSQLGVTVLNLVQNLRLRRDLAVTTEDQSRCSAGGLPVAYVRDALVSWDGPERAQWLKSVWQSESTFAPRKLNYDTYLVTMAVVEAVTRSLAEENVEAVLVDGSLVGSYLFHDFLPWGRTVSLAVLAVEKNKVMHILETLDLPGAIERNRAYVSAPLQGFFSASQAKIWMIQNPTGAKLLLKVNETADVGEVALPPIAIHIHWWTIDDVGPEGTSQTTDDLHVITLDADSGDEESEILRLPASEWQPFRKRPLGLLLLSAPLNAGLYISKRYNISDPYCAARHFPSGGFLSYLKGSCGIVRNAYPHVERHQIADQCIREIVILNNEIQFVAYVAGRDNAAKKSSSMFSLWS